MNTIGAVVGQVLWTLFSYLVKTVMVAGATLVTYGALVAVSPSYTINVCLFALVALIAIKHLFFAQRVGEPPGSTMTDTAGSDALYGSEFDPHYNRNLDPRYEREVTNAYHQSYRDSDPFYSNELSNVYHKID